MTKYILGKIAPIQQGTVAKGDTHWLLNLDMVESNTGRVLDYLYVKPEEIGNSTIMFDTGNVLYSKLRPYLNKVVLPNRDGYATSEMLPLRPDTSIITREYLTCFLRSPHFVRFINGKTSGAKMPRASVSDLMALEIECPTIERQQQITTILEKISSLIRLYNKELQLFDDLAKTRFMEMFGDPIENPKGWTLAPISSFATVKIGPFGSMLHAEDYISGGHPLINPSHILGNTIIPDNDLTLTETKYQELIAYQLQIGDVIIGRRGEIGRCAVVEQDGLFCGTGSMFVRIREKCTPDFLQKIISFPTFRTILEDKAVGVTMKNLNAGIIADALIPLPPKALQETYANLVRQLDKSKLAIRKSLDELQLLYDSLMQEYFG